MFDSGRFTRLAVAQWAEYRKAYAWFIGIGIMVHFVLLLVTMSGTDGARALDTNAQGVIYFMGLFLTGILFAGRYFQAMARPESALVLLMRPASSFEKWLLAFLVVAVLYPVAYTLAYYVCNLPASLLAASAAADELASVQEMAAQLKDAPPNRWPIDQLQPKNFATFHVWRQLEGWHAWTATLLSLAVLQAFAVLGSLYFRAMPFIKTILVGFVLLLASILLVTVYHSRPDGFLGYWFDTSKASGWHATFYPLVWFAVPGLLWLSCYFALREREVA